MTERAATEDVGTERAVKEGVRSREAWFGAAMASTSGAAILIHTFAGVPMRYTVPFVVMPTAVVLVGVTLAHRRTYDRLHVFSTNIMRGAGWGFGATLAYDAIRPPLTWAFGLAFDPYKAMTIFGTLITGRPAGDWLALAAGWTYHFWNGLSFGMMFALLRPRGGPGAGMVFALVLQGLMMLAYPHFLQARLADPGFLMTGIVGHSLWGLMLGLGVRRSARA